MKRTRRSIFPALLAALALAAPFARGDWLVTREGARVETRGAWEVRGRMIVFTTPSGTLSSIRRDEIDLDASRAATEAAAAPQPTAAEEAPKAPVMTLTDRDIGRGEPGVTGPEALVEQLREAHRLGDVGLALRLVQWQDAAPAYRAFMEGELRWLMSRPIRDLRLTEIDPEKKLQEVQEGVVYEPTVEVTHRLEIDLEPGADDDRRGLGLYVGTRLGSYHIAAARIVD